MKKLIPSLVTALGLTLSLLAPAQAAPTVVSTYYLNLSFGPGLEQFAFFTGGGAAGKGTKFIDDFYFNAPPPNADVQIGALSDGFLSLAPDVTFTAFSLSPYQPGEPVTDVPLSGLLTKHSVSAETLSSIDSGIYVLEIAGFTNVSGGSYSGLLTATVPVPESDVWALMLLGLGMVGWAARDRAKREALA